MKGIRILLVLFLVGAFLSATTMVNAESKGQDKLLAKRAALADAYRNLAERVKGLKIDSQTYVRDFVALSDNIRTDLDTFLKGAEVLNVIYMPDGLCEVEVGITVTKLVTELKRIKKQHHFLGHWKTIYFDKVSEYYTKAMITARGQGLPRSQAMAGTATASGVTAGIPGWEGVSTRGRLMAERAALVDAYRMLSERIMGLRIDSQTYVRDFVAESDQIRTDLDTYIKGIRPSSPYRYLPDGICEVDVEVSVRTVVKELITIRKRIRYWQNVRYKTIKLESIETLYPKKIIEATGSGVAPSKYSNADPGTAVAPSRDLPAWAQSSLSATGTGVAPDGTKGTEARIMAERAAKLDAMRNLTEKVYGVKVDAVTTVRDYVTEHDNVKAEVDRFLSGAAVTNTRYLSDGSVEVEVETPMRGVWVVVRDI
jgi:hypothetical protein